MTTNVIFLKIVQIRYLGDTLVYFIIFHEDENFLENMISSFSAEIAVIREEGETISLGGIASSSSREDSAVSEEGMSFEEGVLLNKEYDRRSERTRSLEIAEPSAKRSKH